MTATISAPAAMRSRLRVRGRSRLRDLKQVSSAWAAVSLGRTGTLPSFVIIGAQRAGTTTLFQALAGHPQVRTPIAKELQFLTLRYARGMRWYSGHFPEVATGEVTFEASPYYLFHPLAPARAAESMPDLRAVAMLRDPVKRAYSQWQHSVMHGFETLSFADAVAAEPERLAAAARHGLNSRRGQFAMRHHSYLARGRYADQLQRWQDALGGEQVHVVRSEDYFRDGPRETGTLLRFLGLHQVELPEPPRTNHWVEGPNQLTPDLERRLREQMAPDNERLARMLGWQSSWPAA